jgi:tRNA U54 and U55 pseudouridine synthase Pus10
VIMRMIVDIASVNVIVFSRFCRYIKEWVHGDLGRSSPSLSSLLGCNCTFLSLDVFDVRLMQQNNDNNNGEDEDEDNEE